MVKFGFPLIFSGLSSQILNLGDRYVLGILTNLSIVGVYTLGYKFANLIETLFVRSFYTAYEPIAWKKLAEANARRFYAKVLTYFVFIVFWISLFISIYAKGIIHKFALNEDYWAAYQIVAIVVFAISLRGMFIIVRMVFQFAQKTKYDALIDGSAAILNIGLNFLLIPYLSIIGAALATFIAFAYMLLIGFILANRLYPIKYEWLKIIKLAAVTVTIYVLCMLFDPFSTFFRIFFKFLLFLSYPLILYFFNFYDAVEIQRIKGAYRKWVNWKTITGLFYRKR
jgi:O-antigen/teichoic acid export membrane protein